MSVKERDLENQVRGRSRSLKMAPFDRPYATFYWSAIVNVNMHAVSPLDQNPVDAAVIFLEGTIGRIRNELFTACL